MLQKEHGFEGDGTPESVWKFLADEGIALQTKTGKAVGMADVVDAHRKAMVVTVEDTDTGAMASGEVKPVGDGPIEQETPDEDADGKTEAGEEDEPQKAVRNARGKRQKMGDVLRAGRAPAYATRNTDGHRYEQRIKQAGVGAGRNQARFSTADACETYGAAIRTIACREKGITNPREREDSEILRKAGTTIDFNAGGATVAGDFLPDLIYIVQQFGVGPKVVGTTAMSEGSLDVPRSKDGFTVYAIGEGSSITASDMSTDLVNLTAKKYAAFTTVSNELLNDSAISIGQQVATEFAQGHANKRDNLIFNANGEATYHGQTGFINALLGVDGTIANIAGLTVASGNAWSEITVDDLLGVFGNHPHYGNGDTPEIVCSKQFAWQVLFPRFAAYLGTTVADIRSQSLESGDGGDFMLAGYTGHYTQVMPTAEANSSVPMLFGNFGRAAKFGEVTGGMQFATSEHAGTAFQTDSIAMRSTERVGVNVHDVGDTSTAGPVVGLITAAS